VKFAFPCAGALEVLVPLGTDMPDGIFVSSRYFFTYPQSDLNGHFVKTYHEKFKQYPDYMAGETYAGVYFIKAAVERAGSLDPDKIIAAVEKEPLAWETPEGYKIMLGADHQVVEDCLWGETAQNPKYGFSIPDNFTAIQGIEICRTQAELKAVRAKK
jgi:branched-chain amino acid transport system substrate-binding protein